jgi:hypothetical protein
VVVELQNKWLTASIKQLLYGDAKKQYNPHDYTKRSNFRRLQDLSFGCLTGGPKTGSGAISWHFGSEHGSRRFHCPSWCYNSVSSLDLPGSCLAVPITSLGSRFGVVPGDKDYLEQLNKHWDWSTDIPTPVISLSRNSEPRLQCSSAVASKVIGQLLISSWTNASYVTETMEPRIHWMLCGLPKAVFHSDKVTNEHACQICLFSEPRKLMLILAF